MSPLETTKIQDAGRHFPAALPAGAVVYYHTHGRRQWYGSCKLHLRPDCPHLANWSPGFVMGGLGQLGKTIMREYDTTGSLPSEEKRCKTCWNTSPKT